MTVKELKERLEKFEEDMIVVAYNSEGNYLLDVFIGEINVANSGGDRNQNYYEESSFGEEAVLISINPPKNDSY
jgi:hypothetical protein